MALIQSGAGPTLLTIDPSSNAIRATLYDINGNALGAFSEIVDLNQLLNSLNAAVTINLSTQSTTILQVLGTVGSLTLSFEATIDGTNWFAINGTVFGSTSTASSTTGNGKWVFSVAGLDAIRFRVSTFVTGASMVVSVIASPATTTAGTLSIAGTVNQGTAASLSGAWPVNITDGTNILGTSSNPIRIDPTGTTTQPVSGTVTANAGTGTFTVGGTVAATQSGTWTIQPGNTANTTPWLTTINQGGNSATVTAGNALKVDGSAVTQPVSGTVTANAGTGNFTVVQATAANLNATVTGTVTANIGTSGSLALDTTVSGLQVSQASTTSGQKGSLMQGAVTTAAPTYTTGQTDPFSLTTAGALRVDGSGVTQPVSGTVSANQSGTWTVQPGNTANTTPWLATINQGGNSATVTASNALKVDGSAVTQPVSGTVTANIGTSGSLALDTSVNGILVSQGSATSGEKGPLIQGAVTTAAPTYTTAQTSPLSLTTAGALRVDASATTQPVSGTVTTNQGTSPWVSNITQFGSNNVVTGTGASGVGIPRVTVSNDSNILATQSGTWTVQPGNTANTTPWLSTINQGGNSATVTASNALKVDGSAVTQPVSGTVTSNQGTANTLANAWPSKITDTTNGPVAVKAASTQVVAADPALVVSVSPNSIAAKDRSSMGFGAQMLSPIGGSDNGIARVARMGEFGTQRVTSEINLWHDAFEGSTVNAFWTQSVTTMTIVQATGVLTLNNSGITTASTNAIITSQRQFPKYPRNPLYVRFRANMSANAASNHTLVEMGLGAPSGVTAVISNGAFFRWTAAGNLNAVTSYNGTETSTQILAQGTISTTSYFYYDVIIDDDYARFIVSDASGIPIVDTQTNISLTAPFISAVSHLPVFARVYTDATGGGTVIKLNVSAHSVQALDTVFETTWAEQSAMSFRNGQYSPTAYTSTTSFTTDASTTPTVSSGLNSFGGEFIASTYTASTSALLEHFAFQVPTPYSLVLSSINISPDVVTTAFTGGAITLVYFLWVNASTANTSTATGGTKIVLGSRFFTATQVVGNVGSQLMWTPKTPLVCLPGTFVIMGVKATGTAVTAGVVRHVWTPEGYYM